MASTPKKAPLGSGERFAALKNQLSKKPAAGSPGGLAAFTSNKKFGKAPGKKA